MHYITLPAVPRSIFCVGKNYPDHAREMATWEAWETATEETHESEPIIFMKPGSALSADGTTSIPRFDGKPISSNLHYESELVLLIGRDACEVPIDKAASCIAGYGAGLDMTLRDVQLEAKNAGYPWLKSKGFRNSALISKFISPDDAGAWRELSVTLQLNGEVRQHAPVSAMTFSPGYLVYYLSYICGLSAGDLIFTGTPAGVGSVQPGDQLEVSLETGSASGNPERLVRLEAQVS
ncbi:MAG TPA: FAA hydrolase family protein [Chlorobaculum parvum]|uniref:FAA hydrolase family protein n=1 Tax=Chlorobaculum parvum TaxID=274539 RepID=A0A7C5HJ42_9CHLB|nr:FAA hydrolase family protein [Chlorobaculum parvum]